MAMRRPETWIVFQPITKMKNTTCVFHRYNSQLHFIDFNWPKNSPMHHAFPQGLKRAHQKYSWSSVISGEIKRSHVLLQMYPFHSNIGERDQSMLSVSLLLKEMDHKLSYTRTSGPCEPSSARSGAQRMDSGIPCHLYGPNPHLGPSPRPPPFY